MTDGRDSSNPITPRPELAVAAEPGAASQPTPSAGGPEADRGAQGRNCPWCSKPCPDGGTHCPSCQAALVESTVAASADIPGVTEVDRSVVAGEESARRQLKRATRQRMLGPALGMMGGGIIGHAVGEAIESYMAARAGGPSGEINAMGINDLLALDGRFGPKPDGEADVPPDPAPPSTQLADPWVDLPPPSIQDQIAGTEFDPWAAADQPRSEFDPWANPPAATPDRPDRPATPSTPPGTTAPARDPWADEPGPWSGDPWAAGPGPWSTDLWSSGAEGPKKPR